MIQESHYFMMVMCLAPVLTFFVSAGLFTVFKKNNWY